MICGGHVTRRRLNNELRLAAGTEVCIDRAAARAENRRFPVLVGGKGRAWVALPGKPVLDKDGRPKADAAGKAAYVAIIEWRDRTLANAFSDRVVAAIRREYPEALADDEVP